MASLKNRYNHTRIKKKNNLLLIKDILKKFFVIHKSSYHLSYVKMYLYFDCFTRLGHFL